MVTKKPKGLGRGLEALLGPTATEASADANGNHPGLPASLLLSDMVPGQYQPRTRMDEGALYELAASFVGRPRGDIRAACPLCGKKSKRDSAVSVSVKPDGSVVAAWTILSASFLRSSTIIRN